MNRVIGVHFWAKKVYLSWCESDSISTASFNLPEDLRRDDILKQEFALNGVFKAIKVYMAQKVGIESYEIILAIPDSFGVSDIRFIMEVAAETGTVICRTVTETMAMSLLVYAENDFDGRLLSAVVAENRLSVAEYDFSDAGVEKIETYISGPWSGTSFKRVPFIHNYSSKTFDATLAEVVFCCGTMDSCLAFESALKGYIKDSAFVNSHIEVNMIEGSSIIEGLGYICGKVERREAFDGLGIMDTISPYELWLNLNGDMYSIFDSETELPKTSGIELRRIPESGKSTEEVTVYEKRKRSFVKIGSLHIPKEKVDELRGKPFWIGLNIGGNHEVTFKIQDMDMKFVLQIPLDGTAEESKENKDDEMDITTFIEKIIPIIDNLEYASKFAKEADNPYTQGIIQSYTQAINILEQNGVKVISGEGEPFDYNLQNAVAHVTDVDLPENTVKQVMQTGYMFKGKVIRTASVIVAN